MEVTLHRSLTEIDPQQWEALTQADFPFADHTHLLALEQSGCVGPEAGWVPFYLCVRAGTELGAPLLAATFFYLKNNSYGEFIFDHAWANAYARSKIPYFPKMVSAVPFTPATGNKILVRPGAKKGELEQVLISKMVEIAKSLKCSSLHFLFIPESTVPGFEKAQFLIRHSHQYHWHNKNYTSFEHFLQALKPKRRKQIALERRQLAESGVEIETLTGDQLTAEHARLMCALYLDTNQKMSSHACLNLPFFKQTFQTMRQNIVLFVAKKGGETVAAAINYKKGAHMYGRYWGCTEDVRNLHFELCYYRAIEYSIENKIELYEAGAQGEHKIPRGFVPQTTLSAHEIFHPQFRHAIAAFLEEEKVGLREMFAEYAPHLPYREG